MGDAKQPLFCKPSLNLKRVQILKRKFRPKKASAELIFKTCFKILKQEFCFKPRLATGRKALPRAAQGFKTASRKIPRSDLLCDAPQAKFKKPLKFSLAKPRLKLLFPI